MTEEKEIKTVEKEKKKYPSKEIQRENSINKKYNITQTDYEAIKTQQNGVCEICRSPYGSITRKDISFMIDHCHSKGHVRGLLCFSCNIALGYLKDDVERLKRAINYLERDRKKYYIYNDVPLISVTVSRPTDDSFEEYKYVYTQNVKINQNAGGVTLSSSNSV
jgi:hypothetical protein